MRKKTKTTQNKTSGIIVTTAWRVAKVEVQDGYILKVVFLDGSSGKVEMFALINNPKAGVFSALKDHKLFNKVYLDYGVITWPGEIDLAPDEMYRQIKKNGKWIPS